MVYVTDKQYFMDKWLKENLDEVPRFLRNSWDCVIIVSGHSKVRIGKSTMALQIGYYLAELMGRPFADENIVFTPEELMDKSVKFPRNSILIYDEAMTGLNSSRAMENINKSMLDFFTECGQFGHIIIIVLPNYFRLSEDIAIPRSLFLIDVYADRKYNRGNFAFFNEVRKENLYIFGKKKLGTIARYTATNPNFRGRFTKFMPIDKEAYDKRKKEAIRHKKLTRHQLKYVKQRNIVLWILNKEKKMTAREIAEKMTVMSGEKMEGTTVIKAIDKITNPDR